MGHTLRQFRHSDPTWIRLPFRQTQQWQVDYSLGPYTAMNFYTGAISYILYHPTKLSCTGDFSRNVIDNIYLNAVMENVTRHPKVRRYRTN